MSTGYHHICHHAHASIYAQSIQGFYDWIHFSYLRHCMRPSRGVLEPAAAGPEWLATERIWALRPQLTHVLRFLDRWRWWSGTTVKEDGILPMGFVLPPEELVDIGRPWLPWLPKTGLEDWSRVFTTSRGQVTTAPAVPAILLKTWNSVRKLWIWDIRQPTASGHSVSCASLTLQQLDELQYLVETLALVSIDSFTSKRIFQFCPKPKCTT